MRLLRLGPAQARRGRPATWRHPRACSIGLLALIYPRRRRRRRETPRPGRTASASRSVARHVPGGLRPDPGLHPGPRRPVRGDLRRRDRRLGVDLGHAQVSRRPGREPQPLHAHDVRRDRPPDRGSACSSRSRSGVVAAFLAAKLAGVSTDGLGDTSTARATCPSSSLPGLVRVLSEAARWASRSPPSPAASWPASAPASRSTSARTFAELFLPDIVKYLPFNVASASVDTGSSRWWRLRRRRRPRRRARARHGACPRRRLAGRRARGRARCSPSGPRSRAEKVRSGSRRSRSVAVPVKVDPPKRTASATLQGHLSRRLHRLP